ncbi:MAG: 50S ribosomal protein L9, partial [Eubacteriales bacterium]|nr:50S ribosomal protein L9 [Eubacteriales bacterium]
VNDGYARNYLLPRGIAVEADAKNLNIMQSRNNAAKEKKDREFAKAEALAAKLKGAVIEIKAKAGDNGKLFGSITSMDIADAIKKSAGMEIDKKKIDLSEPIKQMGKTEVDIRLYPGVSGRIYVNVVKE